MPKVAPRSPVPGVPIRLRKALHLQDPEPSLREVARRAGLSQTAVQEIANGNRDNPGADTLWKIARALGVSPCWLAYNEGEGPRAAAVAAALAEVAAAGAAPAGQADVSMITALPAERAAVKAILDTGALSAALPAAAASARTVLICYSEALEEKRPWVAAELSMALRTARAGSIVFLHGHHQAAQVHAAPPAPGCPPGAPGVTPAAAAEGGRAASPQMLMGSPASGRSALVAALWHHIEGGDQTGAAPAPDETAPAIEERSPTAEELAQLADQLRASLEAVERQRAAAAQVLNAPSPPAGPAPPKSGPPPKKRGGAQA